MKNLLDTGSWVVAVITLTLFVVALFVKGFTHDLLLEAGVFLVSVKIIMMSHKNSLEMKRIEDQLETLISRKDPQ